MKKIIALLLVFAMMLTLAACGTAAKKTEEPKAPEVSAEPAPAEEPAPEEEPAPAEEPAPEEPAPAEEEPAAEAGVCTPEAFDEAVAALNISTGFDKMPTYDDVAALFGVDGAVYTEMEYEGYCYYTWTDGKRSVICTFQVSGNDVTYYAISGDIF